MEVGAVHPVLTLSRTVVAGNNRVDEVKQRRSRHQRRAQRRLVAPLDLGMEAIPCTSATRQQQQQRQDKST